MSKVVHLTSVHHPQDTRIFYKECKTLVDSGYDVVLIAPHDRNEVVDDVRIRAVPKPRGRLARVTRTMWQIFRAALAEKAEVYHFHDPELTVVGLLLKMTTRARVIYDVHEYNVDTILEREWLPALLRSPASRLFDFWETSAARFFDAIITADKGITKRFLGKSPNAITLFNYPQKGLCKHDNARDAHPATNTNRVTLVYVGVMTGVRGLWLMLEALEILLGEYRADVELVLAGRIPNEDERARFERKVDRDPLLSGRVNWLGRIPQPQMVAILVRADIGWVPLASIPRFHRNAPTKLFEYMAVGLPVVSSALPHVQRLLESVNAGCLAIPDDPRSHAEQINRLIQSPEEMTRMGENGRQAFLDRYNWDAEAQKLTDLYGTLTTAF